MKKIPTIFERDWKGDPSRVLPVPNPACQWVFDGAGFPTRKLDGTCCMVRAGRLFKRHEIRADKPIPDAFEEADYDEETHKRVGWLPVGDGPEDRWHWAAWRPFLRDGTYELIGPKIQGNPERAGTHMLVPHNDEGLLVLFGAIARDFENLRFFFAEGDGRDFEGLVFHHGDGRMAKIKLRDFGLKRKRG